MKNLSRKEAITILESMKVDIPVPKAAVTQKKRNVALDMAINALNCSEIPNKSDTISRQAAIDAIKTWGLLDGLSEGQAIEILADEEKLPPAQPERDIPIKPHETTDTAWGISVKQAVCPKCDYYLGHVTFLGDYKGKKVTYCETCGQAIDWEGWGFE